MKFGNRWLQSALLCTSFLWMGSLCDTSNIVGNFVFSMDPEKYNPKDYTENLTQLAREGKLLPVFGRSKELKKLKTETSAGRTVLIVGPPGVGKTSLMGEFAQQSSQTVWRVDLVQLINLLGVKASHVSTDQWIELIRRSINFHKKNYPNSLFLVDEIQTIFEGYRGDAREISDAMKGLLDEYPGLVLATTSEELASQVLPRTASGLPVVRRIRQITLKETFESETVAITRQVLSKQPRYCKVMLQPDMVKKAVRLALLFVHRIASPGNALALIKQACNRAFILEQPLMLQHIIMETAAIANQQPNYIQSLVQKGVLKLPVAFYDAVIQDKHKIDEELRLGKLVKSNFNQDLPEEGSASELQTGTTNSSAQEKDFNRWIVRLEQAIQAAVNQHRQYVSIFSSKNVQ